MNAIGRIKEKFRQRKLDAEYQANINKFNVLENPEYKKLYNQCKLFALDVAKAEYGGKNASAVREAFKKQKALLYKKLTDEGIDIDSLYPKYSCPKCKDSGTINGEFCECFKKELSSELLSESGLSDNNLPTFDKISTEIVKNKKQREQYDNIVKVLKEYVNLIPNTSKHIITLIGEVGVGKTHLLKACVNEAIEKGLYCYFTTAFALNQDMLKYHLGSLEEKQSIIEKYLECDLLCIDDLGTENTIKNVTVEYLYLIINERFQAKRNTIITTNLNLEQIMENYDERIFSRIANKKDCVLINMVGDDLRLVK